MKDYQTMFIGQKNQESGISYFDLPFAAANIWATLLWGCKRETGHIRMSIDELAAKNHVSWMTTHRSLETLIQKNMIKLVETGIGRGKISEYRVFCIWDIMSTDRCHEVRREVAGNPSTPEFVLDAMILDDEKPIVRRTIASRPDVTEWQLEMLCRLTWRTDVLVAVLKSPNVPATLLERLLEEELQAGNLCGILSTIIRHPKTSQESLRKIAQSEKFHCWLQLAQKTNDAAVLEILLNDKYERIRQEAEERLESLTENPQLVH